MKADRSGLLRVSLEDTDRSVVARYLQRGVLVPLSGEPGQTVLEFARRVLALDENAFATQAKTIMLNNQVVDDPGQTGLADGDLLVLSGAMPGLVGAMLRSDSPIKAMRADITSRKGGSRQPKETGFVRLKVFNTILRDHLENILDFGIYVDE